MKVLLVGSGGREHALAWKLVQSPRLGKLYIAPGNAGTAACGENVPIHAGDIPGLVAFARQAAIDLVVVGPEVPLTLGLADELFAVGIKVFGPSRAAAQIEGSKVFAKDFMVRHGIPTAASTTFTSFEEASQYLENIPYSFVIKASGLAAGKGVILPESLAEARATLHAMLVEGVFSDAGKQVIIEEKLEGEEVSLLAFSDGKNVLPMPPAQDHKRLLDGDCGPNTGGMGAYAPAPVCPPALVESLTQSVLQPTIDGMWAEGMPFTGVLYAGLMLTGQGPRVLEFNCRFGDPETQAILPLLESDLLEILSACANGRLEQIKIHWKSGACACVVLASENYPSSSKSGIPILGLDQKIENSMVFHAGTRLDGGRIVTNGGRVLNVTAWDQDLPSALSRVYHAIEPVTVPSK
jgi:phosphoribosylamine--glycine ligase